MKNPCKECPHLIRNRHNDMIVDFDEDLNKVKDGVNELKTEIEKLKYTNQDN